MTTVWIVESGDYENRGIDLVAATPETAVAAIKERYADHYVVAWDDPAQEPNGDWQLTGHFEAVRGWSIKHDAYFSISQWIVHPARARVTTDA